MIEPIDPIWLARLRDYDTPTVLNTIELFGVRPRHEGFLCGAIEARFPELPPIVGYASTATFRSAGAPDDLETSTSLAEQAARMDAELPAPRIVVFQDVDREPVGATFGEVMCTIYKAWGCAGLITSGGARDLDQVRRLGFPCWSSSVIASHAWCRIVDVHVPVDVGGCRIQPGDLIHADCNGVAIVPGAIAPEVAIGCGLLVEAESEVLHHASALVADPTAPRDAGALSAAHARTKELFGTIPQRAREALAREATDG